MTAGDDGSTSSKNENGDVGSDEGGNRRFSFSQLSSGEHHGTGDDVNPPPSPPPPQQQQQEVVEEAEAEQVHPLHLDPPVTSAPSARGSHQQKQQDPLHCPSASASGAATSIRTAAKPGASSSEEGAEAPTHNRGRHRRNVSFQQEDGSVIMARGGGGGEPRHRTSKSALPTSAEIASDTANKKDGGKDSSPAASRSGGGGGGRERPMMRSTRFRTSSSLSASNEYDTNLLKRAVNDAGRWAYGILLVEVWALSADRTYLFRPDSGWWIDPVWHRDCTSTCQICRLTDRNRDDFLEPRNMSPGVGLPGVLWSEAANVSWSKSFRETLASRLLFPGLGSNGSNRGLNSGTSSSGRRELSNQIHLLHPSNHVVWRNTEQIAADPDQPWNPRLQLLAELGLGWAAAVPFNLHGDQGIVVYCARDEVDMGRLQSDDNESYLIAATDLIGAAYALRGPRQAVVMKRRKELSNTLHRVKDKILEARKDGVSLVTVVKQEEVKAEEPEHWDEKQTSGLGIIRRIAHMFVMTGRKSRGAGAPAPPFFSWRQTLWTWVGTFLTLLTLTGCSHLLTENYGPEYGLALGPFGALMTLLYGLTAAPASQPRNAMVGQALSMSIGLGFSYLTLAPIWARQSLASSVAIACMVKLGLIHPPAGASALLFASGKLSWMQMGLVLLGNAYAIVMATLINNPSNKRQYPTSWGVGFIVDYVQQIAIGEKIANLMHKVGAWLRQAPDEEISKSSTEVVHNNKKSETDEKNESNPEIEIDFHHDVP